MISFKLSKGKHWHKHVRLAVMLMLGQTAQTLSPPVEGCNTWAGWQRIQQFSAERNTLKSQGRGPKHADLADVFQGPPLWQSQVRAEEAAAGM